MSATIKTELLTRAADLFAVFLSCSFITGMTYASTSMFWAWWFLAGTAGFIVVVVLGLWHADLPARRFLQARSVDTYLAKNSTIQAALASEVDQVEFAKSRLPALEHARTCAVVWVFAMLAILFSASQPQELKTLSMLLPSTGLALGLLAAMYLHLAAADLKPRAGQRHYCLADCSPDQVVFPAHAQPGVVICITDLNLPRWNGRQTILVTKEDFGNPDVLFTQGESLRKSIYWQFVERF